MAQGNGAAAGKTTGAKSTKSRQTNNKNVKYVGSEKAERKNTEDTESRSRAAAGNRTEKGGRTGGNTKKSNSTGGKAGAKAGEDRSSAQRDGRAAKAGYDESRQYVYAIVFAAIAVLFSCIAFINGEKLWSGLRGAAFAFFGFGFFMLTVWLICSTVTLIIKKLKRSPVPTVLLGVFFTVAFVSLIHVVLNQPLTRAGAAGWLEQIKNVAQTGWFIGSEGFKFTGGILGAFLGGGCTFLLGKAPAVAILFFVSFVMLFLTAISVGRLLELPLKENYDAFMEQTKEKWLDRRAYSMEKRRVKKIERTRQRRPALEAVQTDEGDSISGEAFDAEALSAQDRQQDAADLSRRRGSTRKDKGGRERRAVSHGAEQKSNVNYTPLTMEDIERMLSDGDETEDNSATRAFALPEAEKMPYSAESKPQEQQEKPPVKKRRNSFFTIPIDETDAIPLSAAATRSDTFERTVPLSKYVQSAQEQKAVRAPGQTDEKKTSDASQKAEQTEKGIFDNESAIVAAAKKEANERAAKTQAAVRDYTQAKTHESYQKPPIDCLNVPTGKQMTDSAEEIHATAQKLTNTLKSFNVETTLTGMSIGPSVTRYEVTPAPGVKISKITSLADDIALNLAASGVRIEAPIPNKSAVGIEVPNKTRATVTLREIITSNEFKSAQSLLNVALGKDITGSIHCADLAKMPHLLIAGTTGSGKSVCLNGMIASILFNAGPEEVKMILIDPKQVEFMIYNGIPHLLVPVISDARKAAGALSWAVGEMENRYKAFSECSVRDISGFNKYVAAHPDEGLSAMPKVVIFIDELNDLMMISPKEVEDSVCRLAQKARAAGMHLVVATQRPSVDVITGIIKANIPSRISLSVSSQVDSRTILDSVGAEKLLGNGDMLYNPVGSRKPVRIQGAFLSDEEVEKIVSFLKEHAQDTEYDSTIMEEIEKQAAADGKKKGSERYEEDEEPEDEMFEAAVDCIINGQQASTTYLQKRLKLGYARASRLMDTLFEKGFVSAQDGSKPRKILISATQWAEIKNGGRYPVPGGGEQMGFDIFGREEDEYDDGEEDF